MGYTGDVKREYQVRWLRARRQAWLDEHGPCRGCGSNEDLEVDHIHPSLKALNPTRLWSLAPTNPTRIAELEKCQVLCRGCHAEKTLVQLVTTEHGSTLYRNGCRCAVCRSAQTQRMREWRRATAAA